MNADFISRPTPKAFFQQSLKSDNYYADEFINIYLLRPIAAGFVWLIYPTNITPNQVTVLAIIVGCFSAWMYFFGTPFSIAVAGVLIVLKDILDDADGQLARAKQLYSRRGRFLDSIGDFVVDAGVFAAITLTVFRVANSPATILSGFLAFLGITLRVSYHVFYQVSFLHLEGGYKLNRLTEEVTEEDTRGDRITLRLQQVFNILYTWQDRLMLNIDEWCRGKNFDERLLPTWYGDRFGLRLSGLLGFGTELMLLGICSVLNALQTYLWLNLLLMNGIWLASILYKRFVLSRNLK